MSSPQDEVKVATGVFQSQADVDTNNEVDELKNLEDEKHQVINEEFNTDAERGII